MGKVLRSDGEGRGGKWGRWQGYLGKVEFECRDLPRRIGIRGYCGGISVGKVSTIKVDLPQTGRGPSPPPFPAALPPPRTEAGPEGSASCVRETVIYSVRESMMGRMIPSMTV